MSDVELEFSQYTEQVCENDYVQLALQALSMVAEGDPTSLADGPMLDTFCTAFIHGDRGKRQETVSHLRAEGISDDYILETLIPSGARFIGEQWLRDELTFAQVTIAASRMQELVRVISGHHQRLTATIPLGFNVLLIVPVNEDHTLGTFIAADNLRRKGLWVHLAIGQDAESLKHTVQANQFAMIGVSAASRKTFDEVVNIVKAVKSTGIKTPVILGGNIISVIDDIAEKTGADLATSNPREAYDFCGLPSNRKMIHDQIG